MEFGCAVLEIGSGFHFDRLPRRSQKCGHSGDSTFSVLCGIDGIVALIALYYFAAGLGDGSVSSFNMGSWFEILGIIAAVLGAGVLLRVVGKQTLANLVLLILAVPAVFAGLFLGLMVVTPYHH